MMMFLLCEIGTERISGELAGKRGINHFTEGHEVHEDLKINLCSFSVTFVISVVKTELRFRVNLCGLLQEFFLFSFIPDSIASASESPFV
jgi:hypothetical protein